VKKKMLIGLLCFVTLPLFVTGLFTQDTIANKIPQQRKPEGPKTGTFVEDFTLPVLGGGTFKLSDYRGKKIIVLECGAVT